MQCHRCQKFGYTKNYCYHPPPRCVPCGHEHLTADYTKARETPATCALCLETHPANYKACGVRKEILERKRHTTEHNGAGEKPFKLIKGDFPPLAPVTPQTVAEMTISDKAHNGQKQNYATITDNSDRNNQISHYQMSYTSSLETKMNSLLHQMSN